MATEQQMDTAAADGSAASDSDSPPSPHAATAKRRSVAVSFRNRCE